MSGISPRQSQCLPSYSPYQSGNRISSSEAEKDRQRSSIDYKRSGRIIFLMSDSASIALTFSHNKILSEIFCSLMKLNNLGFRFFTLAQAFERALGDCFFNRHGRFSKYINFSARSLLKLIQSRRTEGFQGGLRILFGEPNTPSPKH